MNDETKQLLEEIKAYRNDMVARNYPFQKISNIITKWENKKDFQKKQKKKRKNLMKAIKNQLDKLKQEVKSPVIHYK